MATQFTTNSNLYKWQSTDTKQTTITEMANNMDKLDASLAEIATQVIFVGSRLSGETSDDLAIERALTKLQTNGGGILKFPTGRSYTITYPHNIPCDNCTIDGQGVTITANIPSSYITGINTERKKAIFNVIGDFVEDTGYSSVSGEYICKRPNAIQDFTADGSQITSVTLTESNDFKRWRYSSFMVLSVDWKTNKVGVFSGI
jgi:hypothetical protein